jgi:hypothetical protein
MSRKLVFPLLILFIFSSFFHVQSVEPENKPWLGTWDILWVMSQKSKMDRVIFKEENQLLHGNTEWSSGFIIGWVEGKKLIGTWAREPSFSFPDHGDVTATLSSDGKSFSGMWRIGTEEDQAAGKKLGDWFEFKGSKKVENNQMDPPPAKPKKDFIVLVLQINNPSMRVDEKVVEIDPGRGTTPVIVKGSTLCPIRAVVEALGGAISWNANDQKITLTLKNLKLELWINRKTAKVNGVIKNLSVPPMIINGRTMVPVRFVSEGLGCQVFWDSTQQIITIEYSLKVTEPGEEEPPEEEKKCTISFKINESTHISTRDEEDKTKKERWQFILEAITQNEPDDVVLAYEWKYGENGSWGDRSKDTKLNTILTFRVNTSPFEQEETPVSVRVWDWTNSKILATFEGSVARPIKIK